MPRVRLSNGALRDQIRQDLFDTHVQDAATSIAGITRFFSDVQGKADYLTNLRQNNMLENQVSYLVQGIGFDAQVFSPANASVLALVQDHASFKLVIGEKEYWKGALRFITGKFNTEAGINAADASTFHQEYGSHDSSKYALKGQDSIAIPPLQTFSCELNVQGFSAAEDTAAQPAAGTKIQYVCRLLGLLRRPVQ